MPGTLDQPPWPEQIEKFMEFEGRFWTHKKCYGKWQEVVKDIQGIERKKNRTHGKKPF